MDLSNLNCLQHGPIKLKLLTVWTHQTYVVYSMDLSKYVAYSMEPSTLCCLQYGPNTLTLLTVWDHQTYTVYIIGLVNLHSLQYGINNLRCLQYGPIHPFLQPDKHKPDTT
jgi:hypothetical protein